MKRILIQCLHRPDRSPSQRFRFEQYLETLVSHGYEYHFSYLLDEAEDRAFYKPGHYLAKMRIVLKSLWKRQREIGSARKYDILFVQREGMMLGTARFEKRIAAQIPMIFDFDDAIWLQTVSEGNKRLAFLKNADKTKELIAAAAVVFAGNEYLASYARAYNPNVVVIPTTIDTDKHQPVKTHAVKDRVCIGWSGSFTTIPHFERILPVFRRLKEQYGQRVYFKVVGDGEYRNNDLSIKGIPWSAATELKELEEMDIGIMPLPDDEWAKGKCGFKGLMYMSMGIPAVMSPVGVNTEIVSDGLNGFLASSDDEWVKVLGRLVEDPALRERIGQQGRQTVEERYSVAAWKNKYLNEFEKLIRKNLN